MLLSRLSRTAPGEPSTALVRAITRLARPLVRLLIARGITFPYLANVLKTVYVAVATESLGDDGTTSRIQVQVTGVNSAAVVQGDFAGAMVPGTTLPVTGQHTWRFGLQRMLLGYAVGSDASGRRDASSFRRKFKRPAASSSEYPAPGSACSTSSPTTR